MELEGEAADVLVRPGMLPLRLSSGLREGAGVSLGGQDGQLDSRLLAVAVDVPHDLQKLLVGRLPRTPRVGAVGDHL